MTADDWRRLGKVSRRLVIFAFIALMHFGPATRAEDHRAPICTDSEFLVFFNMIVDHQILFDGSISNANELQFVSRAQIANREFQLSQASSCSDAIAIRRLLVQLGGDSLARAALELADLPADDNPYLQRLPGDQERIERLVSAMLGVDRSDAPPPGERSLPSCAPEELSMLDDAAASFLDLRESTSEGRTAAESLAAIDRLLLWREVEAPRLPECADSIDLIQALSGAATDAAAYEAFKYGGVSAQGNPFPQLVAAEMAKVIEWREQRQNALAAQAASSRSTHAFQGELPGCAGEALSAMNGRLLSTYAEHIESARSSEGVVDLLAFGKAEIAFRESGLAQLPWCAEALEARWWIAEVFADAAARSAIELGAGAGLARRLRAIMADNEARATAALANLESAFEGGAVGARGEAGGSCGEGDILFLSSYLIPKFWQFSDAALKVSSGEEALDLIDRSYGFRQLLWEYLPRCEEALALGLMMRSVAADTGAMLALELAGASVLRIPYLQNISWEMKRFFEGIGKFYVTCGNVAGVVKTYYVVAEDIANIRSCASTGCSIVTTVSRGQRLEVVDDLSSWYEIVLPSCETAYIAGFLASKTPPPR
jgi:hypothetical protein